MNCKILERPCFTLPKVTPGINASGASDHQYNHRQGFMSTILQNAKVPVALHLSAHDSIQCRCREAFRFKRQYLRSARLATSIRTRMAMRCLAAVQLASTEETVQQELIELAHQLADAAASVITRYFRRVLARERCSPAPEAGLHASMQRELMLAALAQDPAPSGRQG